MTFRYDKKTKKLVVTKASKLEYNQVKLWLYRYKKGYMFTPAFKRKVWNGKIDNFKDGNINLGLWKEIYLALNEIGAKFNIENKQDFPLNRSIKKEVFEKFCKDFFKNHYVLNEKEEKVNFFPYDHQIDAAYKILKNRYCTVEVATGGGKSLIISMVFFYILKHIKPDAKFLLVVPSISLVTQFYDEMMEYNYGKFKENKNPVDIRVQEIMSDKPRAWHGEGEPNIIISTYQSLSKVTNFGKKFYDQFYGVACDEAHMAKSESFIKILSRTNESYYQFGVSGTFQDDGYSDFITIQSLTGPKVKKVKAKELQDKGIISYVKILQVHLNHDDYEFKEHLDSVNDGGARYRIEGDYIRNSEPRKEFISKLLKKINKNTLILFNIIDYGTELMDYIMQKNDNEDFEFHIITGKVKKDKREEIKKLMEKNDGKIRILLATYGTLSTGVSIKNLHNIIFAEGFKAEQRIIQSIGRALRLHITKSMAYIYDLVDVYAEEKNKNILLRHGFDRLDMYKKHEYPYKIKKFILT